jgi:hypothetical protein
MPEPVEYAPMSKLGDLVYRLLKGLLRAAAIIFALIMVLTGNIVRSVINQSSTTHEEYCAAKGVVCTNGKFDERKWCANRPSYQDTKYCQDLLKKKNLSRRSATRKTDSSS